ncbi:MAG: hypothetical protein WBA76_09385 [Phormidesmis sp.]
MNDIKVEEVKGSFEGLILDDVQRLKKHLSSNFLSADNNLVANLVQETEVLIREAANNSCTYHERYLIFDKITKIWIDVWQRYHHLQEAIDLGRVINQLTDYSTAYSYLYLSLSLINESRIENDNKNLKRITSGFCLLSEITDVFVDFFTDEEIQAIYDSAKHVIAISARTPWDYFESSSDPSNLTTKLRAYSSLIVLKIDERQSIEPLSLGMNSDKSKRNSSQEVTFEPAWEKIDGTFANSPVYDDAVRLGQEYRKSYVSSSARPLDN